MYVISVLITSTVDPLKRYTRHVTLDGLHGALCRHTGRAVQQEELDGEREPCKVHTQVSEVRQWFGQFPPGLTAQVSKLVEHS